MILIWSKLMVTSHRRIRKRRLAGTRIEAAQGRKRTPLKAVVS